MAIFYILTALSALMFFGFVILGVKKFGLLDCYSAYGPLWQPDAHSKLNPWQIVTILSALLIVPVTCQTGEGNPYQFLGFLAPVSLLLVGASPDYQTDTFANILHQAGAWSAVVFIVLYTIAIPKMLLVILSLVIVALALSLCGKGKLMFWAEMAMYLSTYIILFATI